MILVNTRESLINLRIVFGSTLSSSHLLTLPAPRGLSSESRETCEPEREGGRDPPLREPG